MAYPDLTINDNQTTPMSETNTNSKSQPPRVLRIWLPSRKNSWYMLVVLAVGVLVSYAITMTIFAAVLAGLFTWFNNSVVEAFLILVSVFMAAIGPYLWIQLYNHWQHQRRTEPTRHRCTRLVNLFSAYKSIERLPHRYIEYLLRQRSANIKPIKRALLTMRHRVVIVANGPKLDDFPRLTPNDISFEPIDLIDGEELAGWLVTANIQAQHLANESKSYDDLGPAEGSPKHLYQQARHWISQAMNIAGALLFVSWPFISRSNPIEQWIILALVIFVAVVALLNGVLVERRWWLMPGGLFYREHRFWKKKLKVKLLRATDTPLFLNLELSQAMVVDDGTVRSISFGGYTGLAILAGWISTAHTPTEQEIQSFVGITDGPRSDETKR